MERNCELTVNSLAAKFRSKSELYDLLTREGGIYLPSKQDSTQKYLREIMLGVKLYLKCNDVIVIRVPQYKGLQVKDLLRFAASKVAIKSYLPDYDYCKEPNREWLCNVINTLAMDEFQSFINIKIENRRQEMVKSQNLGVQARPEFIHIFQKSQAVSTMKGKSHFLVRVPKVSKDQQKIAELIEEKKESDSEVRTLSKEIDALKSKIQLLEDDLINNDDNLEKLSNLFKLGIIDENGHPIINQID